MRDGDMLFNKQSFKNYINEHIGRMYNEMSEGGVSSESDLIRRYTISIPVITEKINKVLKDHVEHVIRFTGSSGTFFGYWPEKDIQIDRPNGYAISDAVIMQFEKTNDPTELKMRIREQSEDFDSWYESLRSDAEAFNKKLPELVNHHLEFLNKQKETDKALEEELNL